MLDIFSDDMKKETIINNFKDTIIQNQWEEHNLRSRLNILSTSVIKNVSFQVSS